MIRKFIIESIILAVMVVASIYIVFLQADGFTDAFYKRFTSSKQTSLIIGTSRAAQGIQPDILNKMLQRDDLYNYGFTIQHSPFGPTYLNAIKRKLKSDSKDGIFIIAVDPWAISSETENPNDSVNFRENKLSLATTRNLSSNPNVEYLLESYPDRFFTIIGKTAEMELHDDGWLEILLPYDSLNFVRRTNSKMDFYENDVLPTYQTSSVRITYLRKTISYLKTRGSVFMVRLPVHPRMAAMESRLMPDFDDQMDYFVATPGMIPYLNMHYLNDSLLFTDGNHLYKTEGEKVSRILAEWILNTEK